MIAVSTLLLMACKNQDPFSKVDLIPVKVSGSDQWSMLNEKGEIIYEDEFDNEPTLSYNGVFTVREDDGYTAYRSGDKKPEVLGECTSMESVGYMEDGLLPASFKDERISIMDSDGKKKFTLEPYNGKEIIICSTGYSEGLLAVKTSDDKWGYIDKDGEMKIKPEYSSVGQFVDGMALVSKSTEDNDGDTQTKSMIIDKSGEVKFKLKDKYTPLTYGFYHNYLPVECDNRVILIDKDGEEKKLPAKAKGLRDYNKKFIIFSDGSDEGVMTFDGEIVIRAKYSDIQFLDDKTFLARKSGSDDTQILDASGERVKTLDYRKIANLHQFGLLAKEDGTFTVIDKEGQSLCKEDLSDYGLKNTLCNYVESNYFDADGVAKAIFDPAFKFLSEHALGTSAEEVLGGEPLSSYNTYYFTIDELQGMGFNATLRQNYNTSACYFSFDTYEYQWDALARLENVSIELNTAKAWGERGIKAIETYLKGKGYKLDSTAEGDVIKRYVFVNGDTVVIVDNGEDHANIEITDAINVALTEPDSDVVEEAEVAAEAPAEYPDYRNLVCNTRLSAGDLAGYSKDQLRLMRNTIYAVHGRKFRSADLDTYFRQFSWYNPTRDNVPMTDLTAVEQANMALIASHE